MDVDVDVVARRAEDPLDRVERRSRLIIGWFNLVIQNL